MRNELSGHRDGALGRRANGPGYLGASSDQPFESLKTSSDLVLILMVWWEKINRRFSVLRLFN
jgi:hypothetical protein